MRVPQRAYQCGLLAERGAKTWLLGQCRVNDLERVQLILRQMPGTINIARLSRADQRFELVVADYLVGQVAHMTTQAVISKVGSGLLSDVSSPFVARRR